MIEERFSVSGQRVVQNHKNSRQARNGRPHDTERVSVSSNVHFRRHDRIHSGATVGCHRRHGSRILVEHRRSRRLVPAVNVVDSQVHTVDEWRRKSENMYNNKIQPFPLNSDYMHTCYYTNTVNKQLLH